MSKVVTVRDVKIGEGKPKICVPIVGSTREEIRSEARAVKQTRADLVEWRADWFDEVRNHEAVLEMANCLRKELEDLPILFTFRTRKEGGEKEIKETEYVALNKKVAASGLVDLIDVEAFTGDELVRDIIETAKECKVAVVGSNHDFHKTPSKEEIVKRLRKMQELGADIPKIAVMPQCKKDVLELLAATEEMVREYAERPIITMSMKGMGAISRITGELFGSAVTFGAVKKASAPGQLEVGELNTVLDILHEGIQ